MRSNNPGFKFLLQYWQKYCVLEDWHLQWAKRNIYVPKKLQRGHILYMDSEYQKNVYLVAKGMLARIQLDEEGSKRRILNLATPGMAFMTTLHLYNQTPSKGDIIVLHPRTTVIEIPYKAILDFKEQEPQLNTLINVLNNKKKKQLATLLLLYQEMIWIFYKKF